MESLAVFALLVPCRKYSIGYRRQTSRCAAHGGCSNEITLSLHRARSAIMSHKLNDNRGMLATQGKSNAFLCQLYYMTLFPWLLSTIL